jgi:hypothetical protein
MKQKIYFSPFIIFFVLFFSSCKESVEKKKAINDFEKNFYDHPGIGPISEIKLEEKLDWNMVAEGEKSFKAKCMSCHIMSEDKMIGPGLKGVTKRRRPEWIMNQMLNPMEMVKKDSLSKELFQIYQVQMTDMELSSHEARQILEYFRSTER